MQEVRDSVVGHLVLGPGKNRAATELNGSTEHPGCWAVCACMSVSYFNVAKKHLAGNCVRA